VSIPTWLTEAAAKRITTLSLDKPWREVPSPADYRPTLKTICPCHRMARAGKDDEMCLLPPNQVMLKRYVAEDDDWTLLYVWLGRCERCGSVYYAVRPHRP
jgi:hypothetical protein